MRVMIKKKVASISSAEKKTDLVSSEISSVLENNNDVKVNEAALGLINAACKRIGLSLDDYLLAVKNGLVANKQTVDKYGEVHIEADHLVRLKAATMGLEVEGYLKKGISTEGSGNTYVLQINNILKQLGMSSKTQVTRIGH